ncbi:MAG: Asp-tRNA(Asn)/Glu-tRNA(Gln) amidotransferase subunit GatB [Minisyncoccia bacterium]
MDGYKMTIGLEIHAELKTKSKMFCGCLNSGEEKSPNTNTCPVCMGYPGTLPVINREAVKKVLLVGTAVGGVLADFTEFDRKNYFYPDIPKGYQISQYKYPLVSKGSINGINLTRVHLEEDTARSSHDTPGVSLVDFNRAGVPLMELVTEPEIHSSEEAVSFAKELQLILQYLDVSGANMEKGEMRVEVNISVSKDDKFGTKVEVKNINSFKAVGKAIDFEFRRQTGLIEKGEKVLQETRGWDENKEITFSQRSKENAHDYRYFPDPDLPKLLLSEIKEFSQENLKSILPPLPSQKRKKYLDLGIKPEDVEFYVNNKDFSDFFDTAVKNITDKDILITATNYVVSDLSGLSKKISGGFGKVTPELFSKLILMIKKGELSSRAGKDILKIIFEEGGEPETIAKEKNLIQKNDPEELRKIMKTIISENPESVTEYKKGKESLLQYFVGQGMKKTKGSGNPETLKLITMEILKEI